MAETQVSPLDTSHLRQDDQVHGDSDFASKQRLRTKGWQVVSIPDAMKINGNKHSYVQLTQNRYLENQEIPGTGHPSQYGSPPLSLDLQAAAEAAHRLLEGPWPVVRPKGDRLTVEDDGIHRKRLHGLDHVGNAIGHVRQVPGERADLVPQAMDLEPRAVQLPFHRGRADPGERLG